MGCYRRLIYDAFRCSNRKIQNSASRNFLCDLRRSGIISQPSSLLQNAVKKNQIKSPNFFSKRFCHTDSKTTGWGHRRRWPWFLSPVTLTVLVAAAVPVFNAAITEFSWKPETPYAAPRRSLLLMPFFDKAGESGFTLYKSFFIKGEILASDRPESIRAEKIGREITGAASTLSERLKEYNWEFIVVDRPNHADPIIWRRGGKIVVSTGLLDRLKTDAELAAVIAHEVGHVVARHDAERNSVIMCLGLLVPGKGCKMHPLEIVMSVLYCAFMWICYKMHECEAYCIGMLISASAGYDPRIAAEYPRIAAELKLENPKHYYPSGVSHHKVMEKALAIYRETFKLKLKE